MSYEKMTNNFGYEESSLDVSEKRRLLEKAISGERYTVAKLKGKIKQIESEFWKVVVLWIILIILTIDFFTNFLDFIIIFKIISGNLYSKVAYIIGYVYLWIYTVRKTGKNVPEYISCQNARKDKMNRSENPVDELSKHERRLEELNRELENIKARY